MKFPSIHLHEWNNIQWRRYDYLNCPTGVLQIGKATAFIATEDLGTDKGELIKNKNLIKL